MIESWNMNLSEAVMNEVRSLKRSGQHSKLIIAMAEYIAVERQLKIAKLSLEEVNALISARERAWDVFPPHLQVAMKNWKPPL